MFQVQCNLFLVAGSQTCFAWQDMVSVANNVSRFMIQSRELCNSEVREKENKQFFFFQFYKCYFLYLLQKVNNKYVELTKIDQLLYTLTYIFIE